MLEQQPTDRAAPLFIAFLIVPFKPMVDAFRKLALRDGVHEHEMHEYEMKKWSSQPYSKFAGSRISPSYDSRTTRVRLALTAECPWGKLPPSKANDTEVNHATADQ